MSCIMAIYCSGIPFFLNDHQIKFHNLSDSVIYDSLPQLHGVCHQLEKRWDMHDLLLFRKNRRGARPVILLEHRSVKILIPRRCTSVSLTRNVVGSRYTNITRVKITRVIYNTIQYNSTLLSHKREICVQRSIKRKKKVIKYNRDKKRIIINI